MGSALGAEQRHCCDLRRVIGQQMRPGDAKLCAPSGNDGMMLSRAGGGRILPLRIWYGRGGVGERGRFPPRRHDVISWRLARHLRLLTVGVRHDHDQRDFTLPWMLHSKSSC